MDTYLLKFSACLLAFWLIYILMLERQKMHYFKRIYLLGSLVLALMIPLFTITYYVDPIVQNFESSTIHIPVDSAITEAPIEASSIFTLETFLLLIYGIGALLFTFRFVVNLTKLYRLISKNERIPQRSFIYVLLKNYRIPHSFFKYIFLNKSKFENNDIPKEVLLHEETHAKQWHSLDIILIELLQIVFWFHPLIYVLKHHVKLNHEFLADDAVLQEGSDTKTYQNILLQFSSSTQEHQLASAINYSSIKKRFTVMKTDTSKTRIWLSSLLLLPIIAILFYSFAEREYVEKASKLRSDTVDKIETQQVVTKTEIEEYNAWAKKIHSESKVLSEDATWYPPIDEQDLIKFSKIYKRMSAHQKKQALEYPFPGLDVKYSEQQKATKKQIAAYNAWAKKINIAMAKAEKNKGSEKWSAYPIVKVKEVNKYKAIYNIMTEAQKKVAEPWPSFPPPPPPAPPAPERATVIEIAEYDVWAKKMNAAIKKAESSNNKSYYPRIKKEDYDKYYNIFSNLMTEAQRETAEPWPNIPPPPPPPPPAPEPTKVKKGGEDIPPPPPPPAPESPLEFVIRMAKADAIFFSEGKPISSDQAIKLMKTKKMFNIKATEKSKDGRPLVYIMEKK
ncbi:M56 family metallopeptidase [Winogradskyella sp. MIT101101]|uniref:M56 family metallopeptidase n=1 Tax=Winogradskyella sp. MIT101101 TaxID=3098297 RepID=UPI00399B592C